MKRTLAVLSTVLVVTAPMPAADEALRARLQQFDFTVIPPASELAKSLPQMLANHLKKRRDLANVLESQMWHLRIRDKRDWEEYRDTRIKRLRESLGTFPTACPALTARVTHTSAGDGYEIDNLVYESRPGLLVTANLYRPRHTPKSMPGILICHSHHNPKTQGELQDMGMTWARQGCMVLVMDQLGHGERRTHPFIDKDSYPAEFKAGRQDYYFRYNTSLQLYLVGESLMGWMVWDMMRGVDLLLSKPGIDEKRIILLGAVAGGGDPAAVTAALDRRITAVAPFNFGGPQPETVYPLPADAESRFNYAGGGGWESTRNLALSARDGFLPWVIVGAVAPRGLIYAHEFAWDKERDPVWKRLERIYGFYDARERLAFSHGKGSVRSTSKDDTHCNNIGAVHRQPMHAAFQKWFDMPEPVEYQKRLPAEELRCLQKAVKSTPLHQVAGDLATARLQAVRDQHVKHSVTGRREDLRRRWAEILGGVEPRFVVGPDTATPLDPDISCVRVSLACEEDIAVPIVLLLPKHEAKDKVPVVVAVAQGGREGFLKHRADVIAEILANRTAVCLVDVRGTGESKPGGDSRGRTSAGTSLSATALMLGQPLLGGRLRDLRGALAWLRTRGEVDGEKIALWGDSFALANPPGSNVAVPWDAAKLPQQAEPLGGHLALLAALYDDDVRCVYVRGGLVGYQSILESPFLYLPHDIVVPGALTAGDLCDVAAALAPRALRFEALVDGRNQPVNLETVRRHSAVTEATYVNAGIAKLLQADVSPSPPNRVAEWLVSQARFGKK